MAGKQKSIFLRFNMADEADCGLSVKHCLYPWEMMQAAKFLKNGGGIDNVVLQSVEGLLDECDAEKEACPPKKGRGR